MTPSNLHPDELLWREARGTLSPNERADLTAHLQRCPACALERIARVEAARARVPSEADHALAARLVDRVLAASERRPGAALHAGWRRPLAIAAAVVLLVAGTALAATAFVARVRGQRAAERSAPRAPSAANGVQRPRLAEARQDSDSDVGDAAGRTGEQPPGLPPAPLPHYRRLANPRTDARTPRSRALAYAAPGHEAGTRPVDGQSDARTRPIAAAPPVHAPAPGAERSPALPSPPESPSAVPDPPPNEAPALLRRAEQARTARRWTDASRAFADLGRRYPDSREEIVGRALYGQLLLDQLGDPARALTMFERYLAADPSGALAEEARLGRAQALRRLGRARDERSAWLELLRLHPGSVHAAAARARLATLDAP